ncbi:protein PML-like [Saccostrea echinata]|uniref:protein PML-like n=1 Tax=Saccostrea echinata TaxID=191078 RepID=UPI002A832F05|nr:protein PML-like [Saccostrea echinata]
MAGISATTSRQGTQLSARTRPTTSLRGDDEVGENLVICKLCDKELTTPKHFPCLHTFCEGCLNIHAKAAKESDPSAQIRCPTCSVPVPESTEVDPEKIVARLPSNYLLLAHVMKRQLKTKRCKPCQRRTKTSTAKSWCADCAEALCDDCVENHASIQSSNRHPVIPITDAENNPFTMQKKVYCVDHPREQVTKFCMEHQTACCGRCKTGTHSQCTSFLPIDRAIEVMRKKQELTVLVSQLDTMSSNAEKIVAERKKAVEDLASHKTEEEKLIPTFRERVNEHLDSLEKALKEEFEELHEKETNHIRQDIEVFEQKLQNINYYKELLDAATMNIPPLAVLTEGAKIRQQCQLLEENMQHRAGKIVRTQYELKETDLISKMPTLGVVEAKHTAMHSDKTIDHLQLSPRNPIRMSEKRHNFLALKYQSSLISGGFAMNRNLILVDNKGREVRGYSDSGQRIDTQVCPMYGNPFDATFLPDRKGTNIIAVTIPVMKTIQLLEVGPKTLTIMDRLHFKTINQCFGITFIDGRILVACLKSIDIWDVDPENRLNFFNNMEIEGEKVKYICAADHNRIYYSDSDFRGCLYCITTDGDKIFRYSHKNLRVPMGIALDQRGNVYVAGHYSNNIHQVSPEGGLIQIIAPEDEGFKKPIMMIYNGEKIFLSYESHTITYMYPS